MTTPIPAFEQPGTRLLRMPQVIVQVGRKRSSVYKRIKDGDFPKPIKISRTSGWVESEVQAWIERQILAQRTETEQ